MEEIISEEVVEKVYKGKLLDGEWGKVSSLEGAASSKPQQPGGTWSEIVLVGGQCVF